MTLLPIQQYAHRKEQTIDKHIACGVAKHHVESLTFIYTHHLAVSSIMRYEIKERKQERTDVSFEQKRNAKDQCHYARTEIGRAPGFGTYPNNERLLACPCIVVDVAIVVDKQQCVDDKAAGQRGYKHLKRKPVGLEIIGNTHGNNSENTNTSTSPRPRYDNNVV